MVTTWSKQNSADFPAIPAQSGFELGDIDRYGPVIERMPDYPAIDIDEIMENVANNARIAVPPANGIGELSIWKVNDHAKAFALAPKT